jgi:hypothetical protein
MKAMEGGNAGLGYIHEAQLTGLKPETLYHYRVGETGAMSDDRTFRTGPVAQTCNQYIFTIAGDSRADTDNAGPSSKWENIAKEAVADGDPLFILNGGDLVKNGDNVNEWLNYLEMTTAAIPNTPVMATIGNHDGGPGDGDGANYNQLHFFPKNNVTNTEDYYYFTIGDVVFVSLSTASFTDYAAQAAWLDEVLTQHALPWKFVAFHHPVYTSLSGSMGIDLAHPPNEDGQNPYLVPIFDKHHVDFVINAHNHYYERFEASKGGTDEEANPDPTGTNYVVSGGGGAMVYPDFIVNILTMFPSEGSVISSGKHHYVKFTIQEESLTMETWVTAQQSLGSDPNNRELLDTLTITKQNFPPCLAQPTDDDDDSTAVDDDSTPADDDTTPIDDDSTPVGDDATPIDDDLTPDDDVTAPPDDDSTTADDATAVDDDSIGDDDATTGDDASASDNDDSTAVGNDASGGDDDATEADDASGGDDASAIQGNDDDLTGNQPPAGDDVSGGDDAGGVQGGEDGLANVKDDGGCGCDAGQAGSASGILPLLLLKIAASFP